MLITVRNPRAVAEQSVIFTTQDIEFLKFRQLSAVVELINRGPDCTVGGLCGRVGTCRYVGSIVG